MSKLDRATIAAPASYIGTIVRISGLPQEQAKELHNILFPQENAIRARSLHSQKL
jgi:hypothetical protein